MAFSSKPSNQHFIILLDKVETTIVGYKGSNFLSIFDQLNTNTLSDSRVGLFSLNASGGRKGEREREREREREGGGRDE